jgi:hypothetical protein
VIDYDKLFYWLGCQLDDLKMLYEASGNDRAFGAIKAYEALISQIKLLQVISND